MLCKIKIDKIHHLHTFYQNSTHITNMRTYKQNQNNYDDQPYRHSTTFLIGNMILAIVGICFVSYIIYYFCYLIFFLTSFAYFYMNNKN